MIIYSIYPENNYKTRCYASIPVNDPAVQKALRFLEEKVQPDGGIYAPGSRYRNYETSVSVGALIKANQDGRYDSVLKRAEAFLKDGHPP